MKILESFAGTLRVKETQILEHVRQYVISQTAAGEDFVPGDYDDVKLRTYLLGLQQRGETLIDHRKRLASLQRFYRWAVSTGLVQDDPFKSYKVEHPRLTREQAQRRREIFTGTPQEREIARLRALNQLAEELNRKSDAESTLAAALETLLSVLHLQTGWAFMLPQGLDAPGPQRPITYDDFALAAARGLPPDLQRDDHYYLRRLNGCHCQGMLRDGQMLRAVNIVECTRLRESAASGGDNQGLMFHSSVPILAAGRPLGIINVASEDWQFLTAADLQLLSAIGAQVSVALERARLYDLTNAQRLRLERELMLAREVQDSLLPKPLPNIPGFSLAADWRSALEMAGDFYDVFALPDDRWGIVIADVSDKGAAAAMFMAMTRSLLRASAASLTSPALTLQEVNQRLMAHTSSDMFVTSFYGILDRGTRTLRYASAGQNPALLRRVDGSIEKLGPTGPALGLLEEPRIADAEVSLAAGEVLLIYTDGLTDALHANGEEYGLERLASALLQSPAGGAGELLQHLARQHAAFTRDRAPFDDVTLLVLQADATKGAKK